MAQDVGLTLRTTAALLPLTRRGVRRTRSVNRHGESWSHEDVRVSSTEARVPPVLHQPHFHRVAFANRRSLCETGASQGH
jgi:hypothetical protein